MGAIASGELRLPAPISGASPKSRECQAICFAFGGLMRRYAPLTAQAEGQFRNSFEIRHKAVSAMRVLQTRWIALGAGLAMIFIMTMIARLSDKFYYGSAPSNESVFFYSDY